METSDSTAQIRQLANVAEQLRLKTVFYATVALNGVGYIAYVLSLYKLADTYFHGIPLFLYVLLACSFLAEGLFEVPAGVYADKTGRASSVLAGFFYLILHMALYGTAAIYMIGPSGSRTIEFILLAIGAELALAWGTALQSGAHNSWFVSSMRRAGYAGPLGRYMARRRLVMNLSWLIFGAASLVLWDLHPVAPFAVGALAYLGGFVVSSRFMADDAGRKPSAPSAIIGSLVSLFSGLFDRQQWREFLLAWSIVWQAKKLRTVLLSHNLFWTLGLFVAYFWQRPLESSSHKTAVIAGTWGAIAIARVAGNELLARHERLKGPERRTTILIWSQVLMGAPMAAFPLVFGRFGVAGTVAIGIAFAISRFGQELAKPITIAWIHEEIDRTPHAEPYRATIESVIEGTSGIGMALMCLVVVGRDYLVQGNLMPAKVDPVAFGFGVLGALVVLVNIPVLMASFGDGHRARDQDIVTPE